MVYCASSRPNRQRGVALITAVLIVAIATIIAVAISTRAEVEFRRTETLLHGAQAMQYVLGAEQWVQQILRRDREDSDTDHPGEAWAMQLPPLPVEGGTVIGSLEDLNGRFNLANLVTGDGQADQASVRQLRRLLAVLGLADRIAAEAIVDWIDADVEVTLPEGAEDGYYLGQDPPYRAANRRVAAASELRLVRGFDDEAFAALTPHVAALPRRTAINVNTADLPTLMSLGDEISDGTAAMLIEARGEQGFESLEHFRGLLDSVPDPELELGLASSYFRLTVQVNIGSVNLTMYSLLERADNGRTRVVARSRTPF